jgi:hypothetical protein
MAPRITPEKAREMLKNPPHDQPLSSKQRRFFQAIAHGWRPSVRGLRDASRRSRR